MVAGVKRNSSKSAVMLMGLVATLLTGCYQPAPTASTPTPTALRVPATRPSHAIVIDGSAIVGQIVQNLAHGYEAFIPGDTVPHHSAGTKEGFKLFCEDKTDIQAAVRTIAPEEATACVRSGIDYLEVILAFDALAVVGPAPVKGCISASELTYIYTHAETPSDLTSNLTWKMVRAELPDQRVKLFAPLSDTAAAQFFTERVLKGRRSAPTTNIQDLISPRGISTTVGGIGYLTASQAQKLANRLTIIAVDSGSGCTLPDPKSIWDGSYDFLSRPLYLYINRESLQRGEVFRFLTYTFSTAGQQWITEAGFLPAAPEAYQALQATLNEARK